MSPAIHRLTSPEHTLTQLAISRHACHAKRNHTMQGRTVPYLTQHHRTQPNLPHHNSPCLTPTQLAPPCHAKPARTNLAIPSLGRTFHTLPAVPDLASHTKTYRNPTNPACHTTPFLTLPRRDITRLSVTDLACHTQARPSQTNLTMERRA
jgi:hypothetical protein